MVGHSSKATTNFNLEGLTIAFDTLSNERSRASYDLFLSTEGQQGEGF
jgi:DnaJ-class molecular chaperone